MAMAGPATIDTWIFDLDNTLYPARCNLFAQIDRRIGEYIARFLGVDEAEARRLQKDYWRTHGTSLRGMMTLHACAPQEFLDYVHDIDLSVVEPSRAMDEAIAALPGRKLIFTNGTVEHARRVTERLGIAHHFEATFDIVAADYVPKPEPVIYEQLVRQHGVDPSRALMIDDMAHNLRPAHALGMRTVWVRTEESVGRFDGDRSHIHDETEDVLGWLQAWLDGRPA